MNNILSTKQLERAACASTPSSTPGEDVAALPSQEVVESPTPYQKKVKLRWKRLRAEDDAETKRAACATTSSTQPPCPRAASSRQPADAPDVVAAPLTTPASPTGAGS